MILVLEGFRPDATLFFELDRETSAKRINLRGNLNRLDQEKEAFFSRVADGFEAILKTHPEYCRIDASGSIEDGSKSDDEAGRPSSRRGRLWSI